MRNLMIPISRTRVKICGITCPEDGVMAAELGADAIGLVFCPPSPRFVNMKTAQRIVAALPPFIMVVGLFMNAKPAMVRAVLASVRIDLLQFHGDEEPDTCAVFGRPYLKAVPMGADVDVRDYERRFAAASGLVLDSHGSQKMGGTGQRFDWARIPTERQKPLILAGGLHPSNVVEAIQQVRPYAVDVSSGVESAKGVKDATLMRAFLRGVYNGESHA